MKIQLILFFKWQVFFWFFAKNVLALQITNPSIDDIISSIEVEERKTEHSVITVKEKPKVKKIEDDNLEIICTKTNHSNFRKGPDIKFPIEYKLLIVGYPLKVLKSIQGWYGVEDFDGVVAWISEINVKKKCGAIVKNPALAFVYLYPSENEKIIFSLERGFVINNIECFEKWCKVKIQNKVGWILKSDLWGKLKKDDD